MHKIVIVEDELIAAEYLKEILLSHHFEVIAIIDNGKDAITQIPILNPDIVLMDIMLKDAISGSEVALELKNKVPHIAIVFLTAYAENEMIEYAIESNSYGYLMKPYDEIAIMTSLKIIYAKIKKDKEKISLTRTLVYIDKDLVFDLKLKRLFRKEKEVELGSKSLAILETLCKQPNITISAEELNLNIWGEPKNTSMLRTQISRAKKEIGKDVIQNVKGLGYKIMGV